MNSLAARLSFFSPSAEDVCNALACGQSLGAINLEGIDLSQMDLQNADWLSWGYGEGENLIEERAYAIRPYQSHRLQCRGATLAPIM